MLEAVDQSAGCTDQTRRIGVFLSYSAKSKIGGSPILGYSLEREASIGLTWGWVPSWLLPSSLTQAS
jgi:hypothetical protein